MKTRLSAMILTGGASSRFGSDKSLAKLGKNSLIEELLATLPQEIKIVIVGPRFQNPSREVRFTQESPLGGGPVAAIHAGLELIETDFVAIIATDMPFANAILSALIENFPDAEDATIPLDALGVRQTLCALYRANSLRRAIRTLGSPQDQSMRKLSELLSVKELILEPSLERILLDVDSPADLERAIILSQELED